MGIDNPEAYINGNAKSNLHYMHPDRFSPHITLAKIKPDMTAAPDIGKAIPGAPKPSATPIQATPSQIVNTKKKPALPPPVKKAT